jgi:D-glycero-D-manno-heptose 1,7-bisphosphate phosphatase
VNVTAKRALFLDRDGVINHDLGYTSSAENFQFIDDIFSLCRSAIQLGYIIVVVTNQAGIGRGYYTEDDFWTLSNWMCDRFQAEGAPITAVFHCPFHPEHGLGQYKQDSFDRKPKPGMLLRAAAKYEIDLKHSIMIGDKDSDMQAALSAGVGLRCHYLGSSIGELPSTASTHSIQKLVEGILLFNSILSRPEST